MDAMHVASRVGRPRQLPRGWLGGGVEVEAWIGAGAAVGGSVATGLMLVRSLVGWLTVRERRGQLMTLSGPEQMQH